MRKECSPIVNLSAVSSDGSEISWGPSDADFTKALDPIVKKEDFHLTINLHPVGKHYELKGHFQGHVNLTCSRCNYDFEQPIEVQFHEILAPEWAEKMKNSSNPRDFFNSEVELITGLDSENFNTVEFLNEQIQFAVPQYPKCDADSKGKCPNSGESLEDKSWVCSDNEHDGHIAFSALKNLKIDSKH